MGISHEQSLGDHVIRTAEFHPKTSLILLNLLCGSRYYVHVEEGTQPSAEALEKLEGQWISVKRIGPAVRFTFLPEKKPPEL